MAEERAAGERAAEERAERGGRVSVATQVGASSGRRSPVGERRGATRERPGPAMLFSDVPAIVPLEDIEEYRVVDQPVLVSLRAQLAHVAMTAMSVYQAILSEGRGQRLTVDQLQQRWEELMKWQERLLKDIERYERPPPPPLHPTLELFDRVMRSIRSDRTNRSDRSSARYSPY